MLPEVLEYHSLPDAFREPLRGLLEGTPLPRVHLVTGYGGPPQEMRALVHLDTLRRAGPGVYHLIHHSALDTPEARTLPDWDPAPG